METWMKIAFAIPLILMIVYLFPRVNQMLKNSPKASGRDWMDVLLPIGGVILFVVFLIVVSRG